MEHSAESSKGCGGSLEVSSSTRRRQLARRRAQTHSRAVEAAAAAKLDHQARPARPEGTADRGPLDDQATLDRQAEMECCCPDRLQNLLAKNVRRAHQDRLDHRDPKDCLDHKEKLDRLAATALRDCQAHQALRDRKDRRVFQATKALQESRAR